MATVQKTQITKAGIIICAFMFPMGLLMLIAGIAEFDKLAYYPPVRMLFILGGVMSMLQGIISLLGWDFGDED